MVQSYETPDNKKTVSVKDNRVEMIRCRRPVIFKSEFNSINALPVLFRLKKRKRKKIKPKISLVKNPVSKGVQKTSVKSRLLNHNQSKNLFAE